MAELTSIKVENNKIQFWVDSINTNVVISNEVFKHSVMLGNDEIISVLYDQLKDYNISKTDIEKTINEIA